MTAPDELITFKDIDPEDISDVIVKLEKSFGLKFKRDAFAQAKTFGELCEVFEHYINYEHRDDCTSQQAFHKVREAIATVLEINADQIKPDTDFEEIFPPHKRRQKINEFKMQLGIRIKILTYPIWLQTTVGITVLLSLVAFGFDWRIALAGIATCIITHKLAASFGTVLIPKTIRQLVEQLSREHYTDVRRTKDTINRNEITKIIRHTFVNDLSIDSNSLTKDAELS